MEVLSNTLQTMKISPSKSLSDPSVEQNRTESQMLREELDRISETYDIFVNGETLPLRNRIITLKNLSQIPVKDVLKNLYLHDTYVADNKPFEGMNTALTKLKDDIESKIQGQEDFIKAMYSHDTELVNCHNAKVIFMRPTSGEDDIITTTKTGKPDGICRHFPVILEWKGQGSSWADLVTQGISRSISLMAAHGSVFKRNIVLSRGPKQRTWVFSSYCRSGEDDQRSDGAFINSTKDYVLDIYLCDGEGMGEIYGKAVTKGKVCPDYFFGPDAHTVLSFFQSANIPWNDCLVRPLGRSSSTVHLVSLPRSNETGTVDKRRLFALKVNHDRDRAAREVKALSKLAEHGNHYAVGTMTNNIISYFSESSNVQTMLQPEEFASSNSSSASSGDQNNTWYAGTILEYQPTPSEILPTVIIMEKGDTAKIETFDTYHQVLRSLKNMHSLGIMHTDLRKDNILYFPTLNRVEVIDFDLSCCVGERVKLKKSSAQLRKAPSNIRADADNFFSQNSTLLEFETEWMVTDDYAMFTEYFMHRHGINV